MLHRTRSQLALQHRRHDSVLTLEPFKVYSELCLDFYGDHLSVIVAGSEQSNLVLCLISLNYLLR